MFAPYSARPEKLVLAIIGSAGAVMGCTQVAAAQEPVGAGSDIVVTAQKREESIAKAPIAVSAVDQKNLDRVGATSFDQAVRTIPSLQTTTIGNLAIRGIGTNITIRSASPAVAFHVDGVYSGTLDVISAPIWDVERVEVLRGPQGTLYGRNATAGVVNVITAKPAKDFQAFGDVTASNFGGLMFRSVLNVPLTDTLQVRGAAQYQSSNGYQHNDLDESGRGGALDKFNGRLAVRWQPISSLTWNISASLISDRGRPTTNEPFYYAAFPLGSGSFVAKPYPHPKNHIFQPVNYQTVGLNFAQMNRSHQDVLNIRSKLEYEISPHASATYIFGYERLRSTGSSATNANIWSISDRLYKATSHELDLSFNWDRVRAVVGAFYFRDNSGNDGFLHFAAPSLTTDPDVPPVLAGRFDQGGAGGATKQSSTGLFGQATFDVTEAFRVTGGLRYNRDTVKQLSAINFVCPYGSTVDYRNPGCATGGTFFVNQPAPSVPLKAFDNVSWRLSGDLDLTSDVLAYGSVSTGFKSGGISSVTRVSSAFDDRYFSPETNINYEIGVRSKFFGGKASLNVTAFWTNYSDLQVQTIELQCPAANPTCQPEQKTPAAVFRNAAKARSRGFEVEGTLKLTPSDRLSGFATYLDATFVDFPNAPFIFGTSPAQGTSASVLPNVKGNRLPSSPEWTFQFSYSHIFHLGENGTLTPTVSTYYQSTAYTQFTNGPQDEIRPFWRSDLIVRYETASSGFFVEGFVNNIENATRISASRALQGLVLGVRDRPRTYGLRLGARFR